MDKYTKENIDQVVAGSVALARKHLGADASVEAVSTLAGAILTQALEQDFETKLYEFVCENTPS